MSELREKAVRYLAALGAQDGKKVGSPEYVAYEKALSDFALTSAQFLTRVLTDERFVPIAALHEERAEKKQLREELRQYRERFGELNAPENIVRWLLVWKDATTTIIDRGPDSYEAREAKSMHFIGSRAPVLEITRYQGARVKCVPGMRPVIDLEMRDNEFDYFLVRAEAKVGAGG